MFSVQDSSALLVTVNCITEHEYVKGNPRDHGLLGLAHYKCFGAQSLLSADATVEEKKGEKSPKTWGTRTSFLFDIVSFKLAKMTHGTEAFVHDLKFQKIRHVITY